MPPGCSCGAAASTSLRCQPALRAWRCSAFEQGGVERRALRKELLLYHRCAVCKSSRELQRWSVWVSRALVQVDQVRQAARKRRTALLWVGSSLASLAGRRECAHTEQSAAVVAGETVWSAVGDAGGRARVAAAGVSPLSRGPTAAAWPWSGGGSSHRAHGISHSPASRGKSG